ncbi:hypothetical protein TRAPUB_5151 [Trametes pubescens]|uniref:DUF6535 domain-containing protein n=1 Tax=Trametes pubescens TaxID=154538 RepID=A0A1M2V974_TRAPU|nr:hypothetical protein TRAPUB_5151 [Trametes pubescens]
MPASEPTCEKTSIEASTRVTELALPATDEQAVEIVRPSNVDSEKEVKPILAEPPPLPWTPPSIQSLTKDEQAGLFSAILTAFNVQSYLLLQPAAQDPTLLALQQISAQLSSFSTNPPFINSTQPAYQQTDTTPPPVPRAAVWLNAVWFSSLILSLSSASVGIMVKQWINEYNGGISSGNSRKTAQLRQYRLNGLVVWRVRDIVMVIPVLLQLALALFLAGMLILLWTLDPTVATVSSVLVGILGTFVLVTMFLPLFKAGCCYLSPQTLALYALYARIARAFNVLRYCTLNPLREIVLRKRRAAAGTTGRLLEKIGRVLMTCRGRRRPRSGALRTWRGREQLFVTRTSHLLDSDILVMAYDASMDPESLSNAAICLSGCPPATVIECFERLHDANERHYGRHSTYQVALFTNQTANNLWINALLCLLNVDKASRDARWSNTVEVLQGYLNFSVCFPRLGLDKRHADWVLTVLSSIAIAWFPDDNVLSWRRMNDTALTGLGEILPWTGTFEVTVDSTVIGYSEWPPLPHQHDLSMTRCSRVKTAAAAAEQRLRLPSDTVNWIDVCERVSAATLLVESVARLANTSEVPESVLTRADDALRRLSSDLRRVDPGDMYSKFDAARSFTIKELVRVLVQRHSSLGTLVSRHLVYSLVYAVAMLRNAVRERNLLHDLEEVDFVPKYEELEQLKAIVASDSV